MNQSAANSFYNFRIMFNNGKAGFQIDIFNSNLSSNPLSHDSDTKYLRMPTKLNRRPQGNAEFNLIDGVRDH